ncbi:AfsR/SARP family transcriptional regulator [Saccharopolyspora elongata]|uniref:AfsR/SARP family transcriptional regulator n=1 Tax=Saccharopolyspora elongata TaxID=2530387 RepID=UPI00140428D9|nr:tetratricopeptide repeat protein [Saccharopolyspora elongata]
MTVEFRVLGEIGVVVDGVPVDSGHARQRSVLAALLVDAGKPVSAEQLVDRVWGDEPPRRGRETLYSYLSRLRRALAGVEGVSFSARAGGYVLTIDPGSVDLHLFHQLVAEAREDSDDRQALGSLDRALGLWRGQAFGELDTPWYNAQREALHQQRLLAELDRADVALRLGQHDEMLAELLARAARYPLDERVIGQFMRALYRCGRQATALECFEQTRLLAEELGADPGPALRRLHQQILTGDPDLAAPPVESSAEHAHPPAPRQLPPPLRLFTGRADELRWLTKTVESRPDHGAIAVISAIGGAGKTCLALHWAHQNTDRYPDGQLYVNLRGFDPSGEPMPPSTVLRGFLDALGVDSAAVPVDFEAQVGLYRSLVATKRLLVVLDNARDTAQVEPLLPSSPACAVVVTSRHKMTGLRTRGAHVLDLDVLADAEAMDLLADHIGRERVAAEPDSVAELLRACGGLPLAVCIVAARADANPDFPLSVLAAELRDTSERLDALDAGEVATNLRAVFSWSFQAVRTEAASLFRLIGASPGGDIGLPAAAALAAAPISRTRLLLRELETAHLVQQRSPGRFRMHDLVRAFATDGADQGRTRPALTRLMNWYVHAAHAAMDLVHPNRRRFRGAAAASTAPLPELVDLDAAMDWLETEHRNLVAAIEMACTSGWPPHAAELAQALGRFFLLRGHFADWISTHRLVLDNAGDSVPAELRAETQTNLATGFTVTGRLDEAIDHLQRALPLWRLADSRRGEANALGNLGIACVLRGRYTEAIENSLRAASLSEELGDITGQANSLNALGIVNARLGRYERSEQQTRHALLLYRQVGDRYGAAAANDTLGNVCGRTGRYEEAIEHCQDSIALCREIGNRGQEIDSLGNLALVHADAGNDGEARRFVDQTLDLISKLGSPASDSGVLNDLGAALRQLGEHRPALAQHESALAAASDPYQLARAHWGLAQTLEALGRHGIGHRVQASELFVQLGVDERFWT